MTSHEHRWDPVVIDSVEVTPGAAPHGAILVAHLAAPVPERWPEYLRDALGDLSLPFHDISFDEISVPVESRDEDAVQYARLQVEGAIGLANQRYEALEVSGLKSQSAGTERETERQARLKEIQDKINTADDPPREKG